MNVMILAAGRGNRLKPLTHNLPKPLIKIANQSLIEYHLKKLSAVGFKNVVINLAWLGEKIIEYLQDGSKFNLKITYSKEGLEGLETAGGIANALPLLGNKPFLVINADIFTGFDFNIVKKYQKIIDGKNIKALLWLIKNPTHNTSGDFSIDNDGFLSNKEEHKEIFTFTGIGIYHPILFKNIPPNQKYKLSNIFLQEIPNKTIKAKLLNSFWFDAGTIERLKEIENFIIQTKYKI